MPISTSTISGTVAHKHSGTGGGSDGGKLKTGGASGDTSFDLAGGSMMYSNGTSLLELASGSPSEVVTMVGGVPTWQSIPSVTGGKYQLLNDQTASGSGASPIIYTPGSPLSSADYSYLRFILKADETLTGTAQFWGEVNSLSSNYGLQGISMSSGSVGYLNNPYGTVAWNYYDPVSPNASAWIFTMDLALPTTPTSDEMTMVYTIASDIKYVTGGGYVSGTGGTFTNFELNFQGSASVRSTDFQVYGIET
tara:strand:- start:635 stop:1387 length:753 start_codon:yes stop_codon:yes gene_type:complete